MQNKSINSNTLRRPNEMGDKAEVWHLENKIGQKRNIIHMLVMAAIFLFCIWPENLSAAETGTSSGVFSVSASKKVHFAQGNLQYQASTGKWRIAPNPWDIIGEANSNISPTYSGWIDLFGWGTGDDPTRTSQENGNYSSFVDWGSKYGGGWRTLTADEWNYVLRKRKTASGLRWAQVTLEGVDGFILLPDDWKSSIYKFTCTNKTSSDIYTPEGNTISASIWNNIFATAGAVFLPAAGMRDKYRFIEGDEVLGTQGNYWTSTTDDYNMARYLYFHDYLSDVLQIGRGNRSSGYSVRLVCPAQ